MENKNQLDRRDLELLRELQSNARLSFAELGRRVHLSGPAVAERVQKLESAGMILGYRAVVDPEKLGLPITALVQLQVTPKEYRQRQKDLAAIPEIVDCYHTTGDHCVFLKICVRSIGHLDRVLEALVQFGEPTTSVVLNTPVSNRPLAIPGPAPGDA